MSLLLELLRWGQDERGVLGTESLTDKAYAHFPSLPTPFRPSDRAPANIFQYHYEGRESDPNRSRKQYSCLQCAPGSFPSRTSVSSCRRSSPLNPPHPPLPKSPSQAR